MKSFVQVIQQQFHLDIYLSFALLLGPTGED